MKRPTSILLCKLLYGAIGAAFLITPPSVATDYTQSDVRAQTYCYPTKQAQKTITQLAKVKAEKRDIVDVKLAPRFLIYDNGALPERYFISAPNDESVSGLETDFTINQDGSVPDFVKTVMASPKGTNICITDTARIGLKNEDESLYFEMGLTPFFNNRSGRHTLTELKEGTKDGKSHYKAMVPAAARAFMPKTEHFLIKYEDMDRLPEILAETENGLMPITSVFYNEGYVISIDQLGAQNASALIVKGGTYKLAPVPSIKTMKRFGVGKPRGPQNAQSDTSLESDTRTVLTNQILTSSN